MLLTRCQCFVQRRTGARTCAAILGPLIARNPSQAGYGILGWQLAIATNSGLGRRSRDSVASQGCKPSSPRLRASRKHTDESGAQTERSVGSRCSPVGIVGQLHKPAAGVQYTLANESKSISQVAHSDQTCAQKVFVSPHKIHVLYGSMVRLTPM